MGGGPISAANKIGAGYAAGPDRTGFSSVGERRWRNFGRGGRVEIEPIGLDQAVAGIRAEMAEIRQSSTSAGCVVARSPSHGGANGLAGQSLSRRCRLMAGLKASSLVQLRAGAIGGGAASPFRVAGQPGGVASERRQIHEIRAEVGLQSCLDLRSSRSKTGQAIGSGPGARLSIPKNGVGGAGSPLRSSLVARPSSPTAPGADAKKGSAARRGGAEGRLFAAVRHSALAPFVERRRQSCSAMRLPVNASVQSPVDNAL